MSTFCTKMPTNCAGVTRTGNSLKARWRLNPETKECPAPSSHVNTDQLSLLWTPLFSRRTLPWNPFRFFRTFFVILFVLVWHFGAKLESSGSKYWKILFINMSVNFILNSYWHEALWLLKSLHPSPHMDWICSWADTQKDLGSTQTGSDHWTKQKVCNILYNRHQLTLMYKLFS